MFTTMFFTKLPEAYLLFRPLVDILPIIPIFFLLLAFVWQAAIGFRQFSINEYSLLIQVNNLSLYYFIISILYGRTSFIGHSIGFNSNYIIRFISSSLFTVSQRQPIRFIVINYCIFLYLIDSLSFYITQRIVFSYFKNYQLDFFIPGNKQA